MSERTSYQSGEPNWVDLGTTDIQAATKFYSDLFGWEVRSQGEEFGNYGIAFLRDKPVAGIGPIVPGSGDAPTWSTYLATADLDATMAAAAAAGGTVTMPATASGEFGRRGFVQDPTGANVGFWEAKQHLGAQLVNEPAAPRWSELATSDADAADKFYGAVFGYEFEKADGLPDPNYTMLKVGGETVAGRYQIPAGQAGPSRWLCYFTVADVDATVAKVTATGGALVAGPVDSSYGRFVTCADPSGAAFGIVTQAG
ncbi:MAG: VOC family protein [Actinobacteria bacterium]|nr:VOC family protein [Actinomycetota bacterium]MBI3687461.1 VOC family protein [Actinomycetota bacterium]